MDVSFVALLGAGAGIVTILSWRPVARGTAWLWAHNVSGPVGTWIRGELRNEIVDILDGHQDAMRELVTTAVRDEVQRVEVRLEATMVMHGERLAEIGRLTRQTSDQLQDHVHAHAEHVALERAARKGLID